MTQAYNLSQLANFVNSSGQVNAATGLYNTGSIGFASGTRMSFNQTAAPTGWTKDTSTTINDSILRFVTGSVSSGGTTDFSTWNASGVTGDTTLSTPQIPSHTHTKGVGTLKYSDGMATGPSGVGTTTTGATGGDGSHNHSLSNNIKYYDFIIAQKD